jgi:uncharacterized protein involved in response to NO
MVSPSRSLIMNVALSRRRDYAGPALFSYGFRPFFLAAGLWAAFGILLWMPQYYGNIALPTAFGALDWHIHEMLFGYVAATIAGFLLTAVPNWTGRLPVNGWPLAGLAALWLAGRVAIATSALIGPALAAVIDVAFLVALAGVAAREIVAGKNWRNLRVLVVVSVLAAGNIVFHVEAIRNGAADYGVRLSLGAVILLISLVGGRIVPSFTNNWLARNNPGRLPVPFSRFDAVCIASGAVAIAAWVIAPLHGATGALLAVAGLAHLARLARWAGDRTVADRLVLVLHAAYAFVPVGFLLLAASAFWPSIAPSAGIHAWTAGAIGMMTLAVMTRASLGHTGHALSASAGTQAIYALAFVAAVLRVAGALTGEMLLVDLAAGAWIAAFAGFVIAYGPLLVMRRPSWEQGRA